MTRTQKAIAIAILVLWFVIGVVAGKLQEGCTHVMDLQVCAQDMVGWEETLTA